MKKITKIATLLVAGALSAGSTAIAADFTFKYGNSQPEQASRSQSMIYFEKELEKRSGGRIEVENYFNAVLGTEKEMYDLVTIGSLQGTRGGFFPNASRKFSLYNLPFLTTGWDQMLCLMNSDFTKGIQETAAANGIHVPATGVSQGFRMYTNNVRPITEVGDLKGLKIREPQNDFYLALAKELGGNVIAMAFSEVYQAFKQGVIDGQHNPPANIYNFKLHEVQKYLSVTNHMSGPDPLLVNKAWYDSLPADLQKLFDEVAVEAMKVSNDMARKDESALLDKLAAEMEVNYLTEEGIATFRKAVQPVYQQSIDKGWFTADDIAKAQAAAKSCG